MGFLYVGGTILLTVYGQLITKWQVEMAGVVPPDLPGKASYLLRLVLNPWVLSSLAAAFMAFLCWIGALTKFELSFAYPFTSLSFVAVVVLSAIIFRENMTASKIIGSAVVIVGLIVLSRK